MDISLCLVYNATSVTSLCDCSQTGCCLRHAAAHQVCFCTAVCGMLSHAVLCYAALGCALQVDGVEHSRQ
jgi:hypothetical protein